MVFPSSAATAITIRSMHLAAEGGTLALRKMRALSWAFVAAASLRVLSQYAMGLLWVSKAFLSVSKILLIGLSGLAPIYLAVSPQWRRMEIYDGDRELGMVD